MSIKTTVRSVGDVTIIDVAGRITLDGGSSDLRDLIRKLASKGHKKVILNLTDTSYADSSGIGELVSGFVTMANCGANLKILAPSKRVKDLLQITKLYTVFEIYDTEDQAIRSFHNFIL